MRKLIIPISMGLLCSSFAIIPSSQTSEAQWTVTAVTSFSPVNTTADQLYENTHLKNAGLSKEAFDYAWKGYCALLASGKLDRSGYLTICDFSQSSKQKRLYIVDVNNCTLLKNTYVAHGRNSGGEYASQFSNTPGSLQSSLGFYTTLGTYSGAHGLSLKLQGLEPGYNDRAYERTIVLHGADYVNDDRARSGQYMGRSYGCPAIPGNESASVINIIKNGTCLFIYHPAKKYLLGSKILNG